MGHRWWRYSRVAPALILATGGLLPTWGAGALSTGRARCSGHHIHPGLSVSTRVGPTVQWNLPALIWTLKCPRFSAALIRVAALG